MDEHLHAVILAGGHGTRFWPHSRMDRPKQLLAPLDGPSLLRRTLDRIAGIVASERTWTLTSNTLLNKVSAEVPELPPTRIIGEPTQRNTAPAIGLVAALLLQEDQDAVMGVFPADHHIADEPRYREIAARAFRAAEEERLVVLGISPTSPETGYGYIEFPSGTQLGATEPAAVVRFREKPDLESARNFLTSGRHFWNSGQFFWKASVLAEEMARHLPGTWAALTAIAQGGPHGLAERLAEHYPRCENVSIDVGVLEKSDRVEGFAADGIGWTDLGSWNALHSLLPKDHADNCNRADGVFVRASGNYVDAPGKLIAMLGVNDLVVVDTADALLICPRSESQHIPTILEALRSSGRNETL